VLAKRNFEANANGASVSAVNFTTLDISAPTIRNKFDVVVASEILYDNIDEKELPLTLSSLLEPDGRLVLALPTIPRVDGDKDKSFTSAMLAFEIENVKIVDEYEITTYKHKLTGEPDMYLKRLLQKQKCELNGILQSLKAQRRKTGHWIW